MKQHPKYSMTYVTSTKPTNIFPCLTKKDGWYLAGLADGEGCFNISKKNVERKGSAFTCSFIIKLRRDDREVLDYMCKATGLGTVREGKAWTGDGAKRNNNASWVISRKAELVHLTEIFDTYTLRGKKKRDYDIWRQAVLDWSEHKIGNPWDWIEDSYNALRATRKYREIDSET